MILAAVIVPSAMSAAATALFAIDAEFILDNGMTLFVLYSVYKPSAAFSFASSVGDSRIWSAKVLVDA